MTFPLITSLTLNPEGRTYSPGSPVSYSPRIQHDPASLRLLIKHVTSGAVWLLPIQQISYLMPRFRPQPPSGTVPTIPDAEDMLDHETHTRQGFFVPQLPRGEYQVYYESSQGEDRPLNINIHPRLGIDGLVSATLGSLLEVKIKILGPRRAPRLVTPPVNPNDSSLPRSTRIMLRWATGAGPLSLRVNIHLDMIENDQIVGLVQGQAETRRTNALGIANFSLVARHLGQTRVHFTADILDGVQARVIITPVDLPAQFEPPNMPFLMHTFGDSVAWGQGLLPEHKYDTLVRDWLADRSQGRDVILQSFAHSGAVTTVQPAHQSFDDDPDQQYHGEIPLPFPSAQAQLRLADDLLPGATAHLLLINSGMNDVGLFTVLNPTISENDLRAKVRELDNPFRLVLRNIARDHIYRKAAILVAGYYSIISEQTPDALIRTLLSALGIGPITAVLLTPVTKAKLIENCRITVDEIHRIFRNAVRAINQELDDDRIRFVSPAFLADWAYGAPETRLWTLGDEDEVLAERIEAGEDLVNADLPVDIKAQTLATYRIASVGHPNLFGAERYAERLVGALEPRSDLWDLSLPRRRFDITLSPDTIPVTVVASQRIDQAGNTVQMEMGATNHTFSLVVRDAATGERIDNALVYREDRVAGSFTFLGLSGASTLSAMFVYVRNVTSGEIAPARLQISHRLFLDQTAAFNWDARLGP